MEFQKAHISLMVPKIHGEIYFSAECAQVIGCGVLSLALLCMDGTLLMEFYTARFVNFDNSLNTSG